MVYAGDPNRIFPQKSKSLPQRTAEKRKIPEEKRERKKRPFFKIVVDFFVSDKLFALYLGACEPILLLQNEDIRKWDIT